MALEKELDTYRREKARLLAHEGKYVLVHGDEISGFWDTYEDALKAAYEKYELEGFLVKRIEAVETVHQLSRDVVGGCRT